MDPRPAALKTFVIFKVYCSYFVLDFYDFFKNTYFRLFLQLMIYDTGNRNNDNGNWNNDKTKNQKEKQTCFNAHAGGR